MSEKELFPPLKKHFKERGYAVYAEVPVHYRSVDFVAVKDREHIAVEMKMRFSDEVVRQAHTNKVSFHKTCIAYPVKKFVNFNELRESVYDRSEHCRDMGIGIIQVLPRGTIFWAMEPKHEEPWRKFDFSEYEEHDEDEAGLPYQKGVSAGYMELKAIMTYVREHPKANWREIFENVQNHYASHTSLAGSMRQWRGFSLQNFKETIKK